MALAPTTGSGVNSFLRALYRSCNGHTWPDSAHWMIGDPCEPSRTPWERVGCKNGRAVNVTLNERQLAGTLPAEIGLIHDTFKAVLWFNQISGTIPPEVGKAKDLKLQLYANQISGFIPSEVGRMRSSDELEFNVYANRISGTIPSTIGLMSAGSWGTAYFDAKMNDLSGTLPTELGEIRAGYAIRLHVADNYISGTVPSQLGQLSAFQMLDFYLYSNRLSGTIPFELGGSGTDRDIHRRCFFTNSFGPVTNRFHGPLPGAVRDACDELHELLFLTPSPPPIPPISPPVPPTLPLPPLPVQLPGAPPVPPPDQPRQTAAPPPCPTPAVAPLNPMLPIVYRAHPRTETPQQLPVVVVFIAVCGLVLASAAFLLAGACIHARTNAGIVRTRRARRQRMQPPARPGGAAEQDVPCALPVAVVVRCVSESTLEGSADAPAPSTSASAPSSSDVPSPEGIEASLATVTGVALQLRVPTVTGQPQHGPAATGRSAADLPPGVVVGVAVTRASEH